MKRFASVCFLVPALSVATWANIIPTLVSTTGAGPFTWTYSATLSSDQNLIPGTFPVLNPVSHTNTTIAGLWTLYDFAGYVAGSCAGPVGFVCSAQGVGFTPDDVVPTDNPGLVNITWAYTSGPTIVGGNGAGPGVELGNFTAQSAFNASVLVSYAGRGFKNNGPGAGTVSDNVGVVAAPSGVPEPLTMATMGLGLMILAVVRKSSK